MLFGCLTSISAVFWSSLTRQEAVSAMREICDSTRTGVNWSDGDVVNGGYSEPPCEYVGDTPPVLLAELHGGALLSLVLPADGDGEWARLGVTPLGGGGGEGLVVEGVAAVVEAVAPVVGVDEDAAPMAGIIGL